MLCILEFIILYVLGTGGMGAPHQRAVTSFPQLKFVFVFFCHKNKCLFLLIPSRVVKKILKAWSKEIWGCRDGAAAAELVPLPE